MNLRISVFHFPSSSQYLLDPPIRIFHLVLSLLLMTIYYLFLQLTFSHVFSLVCLSVSEMFSTMSSISIFVRPFHSCGSDFINVPVKSDYVTETDAEILPNALDLFNDFTNIIVILAASSGFVFPFQIREFLSDVEVLSLNLLFVNSYSHSALKEIVLSHF